MAANNKNNKATIQAAADTIIIANSKSITFCYLMFGLILLINLDWLKNLKLISKSPPASINKSSIFYSNMIIY